LRGKGSVNGNGIFFRRQERNEADLPAGRQGDPAKGKLAAEVRAQTTLPLAWIAERLATGRDGYLTWLPYRQAIFS
jgi:hypothetical protein